MPVVNKANIPIESRSPTRILIENNNDNSHESVTFIPQLHTSPRQCRQQYNRKQININVTSSSLSPTSMTNRTPTNFYILKQQRLIEAADRKKRIITRLVSVIGLLIIILCAAIVTLTLKMAPKIDELVRSRAGKHQLFFQVHQMTTPLTTSTIEFNNFTTNSTSISNFLFHARRRSFV